MSDWIQAQRHAQRGHHYLQAGELDKALHELRQALQCDPLHSAWHEEMARTLEALRRYREAAQALEQVLRLRGEDVPTLVRLAGDLVKSDQPRRAIETLERVETLDPMCEASYCHRILIYTRLGDHESAELMFYLARLVEPQCPRCYDYMARSFYQRHLLRRAAWCWEQTARLQPQYPCIHTCLGRCYWAMGQRTRAARHLQRQARLRPDEPATLLELGHLLIEMGRHRQAELYLRQALDLSPRLAAVHEALGHLALNRGRPDLAEARFCCARTLAPQRPGIRLGLARVAHHRGQPEHVRQQVQAEAQITGQLPGQIIELARRLIELDLCEAAIELLNPLIAARGPFATSPHQRSRALATRARAYELLDQWSPAVADCRLALRISPDRLDLLRDLVQGYLAMDHVQRAGACLRRLARRVPSDPHLSDLRKRWRWRWIAMRLCGSGLQRTRGTPAAAPGLSREREAQA